MSGSSLVAQLINAGNLENLFDTDAEQLRYWYDRISEINIDELVTNEELAAVANACRLIMQYERTNAEELRELAEREAVEAAEREENWAMEREMLKDEISVLRDRITMKAGFDDANEAFRAEIDSLTSENAMLRQQARERDRELADQRDRSEELSTRLQATERERALFAGNQTELEEQIKELNRRINVHSDMQPQRNDWETRRLRQRNEQAIALSNQLQSVISQNEQLKAETERVTMALESATVLIQEQNAKFANYAKQLSDADSFIEQLRFDIRELRVQIAQKDANLSHTSTEVEASGKALTEIVSAKEMELNRLQVELEQRELEVEELRAHLHLQQNEAREAEIERLHDELVAATETARQLFGNIMSASHGGGNIVSADPNAELRMRIIEMDKKLHVAEKKITEFSEENSKIIRETEEKDMTNARLNGENQRLRQAAFGSAREEIHRLERQINYRDRQIQELNRYCSLLQINLLEQDKGKKTGEKSNAENHDQRKLKEKEKKIDKVPKRRVMFVPPPGAEVTDEAIMKEEDNELVQYNKYEEHEIAKNRQHTVERPATSEIDQKPLKYGEIEPTIMIIDAMHLEILKLNEELHHHRKDIEIEKRLRMERETLLRDAKNMTLAKQREIDKLKAIIYSDRSIDDINAEVASTNVGEYIAADIATLRERSEELEVENAELRRLAENIEYNGAEFERRAAEATHRIVFLAIQNVRYERRIASSELIRRALAYEHANLRIRLQRILSGEERRSRQLDLENEEKLIEIARLQNILLHCVPWTEYQRVQRAYKQSICSQTVSDSSTVHALDGGYHSANGEDNEDDDLERFDISIKALAAYNNNEEIRSNSSSGRWTDKLVAANRRLNEENEVRRSQCDFWQSEIHKKDAEIEELNAFISDIENETELKSMLVNIERRFLRMINEQSENEQERILCRNEALELRKNLQRRRVEWNGERQELVKLAIHLRGLLRRVQSDRITVTVSQLDALKRATSDVKRRDQLLVERQKQIDQEASDLERKSTIFESTLFANDEIFKADYQLKNIQTSLQGAHMSVLTLGAKLRRAQEETAMWRKLANDKETRVNQLEKELNDFNFTTVDLRFLERCQRETARTDEKFRNVKQPAVSLDVNDSSDEFNGTEHIGNDADLIKNSSTIVIDNSAEYQRQIEALQSAAKLCIKTYEDQLLQRDKTIEEYKRLLESVRERPHSAKPTHVIERESSPRQLSERMLTSAQILLDSQDVTEQLQRRVHILEREHRSLQTANAALTDRLEAEVERAEQLALKAKKEMIDEIVQVELRAYAVNDQIGEINSTQIKQSQSTESSANQERSTSADSSQSEGQVTEPDSAESETDSGTVDDIDDDRRISSGSISSQDSARKKSASTTITRNNGHKTVAARKQTIDNQNEADFLQKHRNETRRLKMRIITLEKKIKDLTDENTVIRERGRFNTRPADPNAEANILRKQSERMHRENANLTKSLRDRAEEIDKMKKALKKNESINPAKLAADVWEERKRHAHAQNVLKQRVADLTTQQQELQERLSRREKFIEQLTRENISQHNNAQKISKLQNDWSTERAALAQREQTLRETVGNWMEKYHNATSRLDSLIKEKNSLNQRLISLQGELEHIQNEYEHQQKQIPPVPVDTIKYNMSTQTSVREQVPESSAQDREPKPPIIYKTTESNNVERIRNGRRKLDHVIEKESGKTAEWESIEEVPPGTVITPPPFFIASSGSIEITKKLRKAELMGAETTEQLIALRSAYEDLLKNYKYLMYKETRRENAEECTAVAVLRDKLVGKDREIEHQRHKIVELERKLWNHQMGY